MKTHESSCCNSVKHTQAIPKKNSFKNSFVSFLSTLFIIIIPKCPFCVAAYSGAILMFFDIENEDLIPYFTHAKPVLGLIIIALILFNYNKSKSKIALAVAIPAFILLLLSTYGNVFLVPDWIIYTAFFFSAWYNGNFRYFYRFLSSPKQVKVQN